VEHGPFYAEVPYKLERAFMREAAVEDDRFSTTTGDFEKPTQDVSLKCLFDLCLVVESYLSKSHTC
jgi:hypothetical protein